MPTTFPSNGSVGDVQAKVNFASPGDTVTIPPGTFNWNTPLTWTAGKNIKLLGTTGTINSGTLTRLIPAAGMDHLIEFKCENSSGFTAELGRLEFYGEGIDNMLKVNGVSTISHSGSSYSGGMLIHDIRWLTDINRTGDLTGHHMLMQGWIFGCMYHCEVIENLARRGFETMRYNHETSPTGAGDNGDFSYWLAAGQPDLAAKLDMWVIEDCIFRHTGAITDSGGDIGGGARYCARHNTHWSAWASHGTRESGVGGRGCRLMELYNNHALRNTSTFQPAKREIGFVEGRDGEIVAYNNFVTVQTGGTMEQVIQVYGGVAAFGTNTVNNVARWNWGADGLNPWDDNAKANPATGNWTDPYNGKVHHVLASYTHTQNDAAGMEFYGGQDRVVAGIDDEPRCSDVFGTVSGATTAIVGGEIHITGTVTGHPGTLPANLVGYFDGFVLRNPVVSRTRGSGGVPTICCKYITDTQGSSNGTTGSVDFTVEASNQAFSVHPQLDTTGGVIEIRRVQTYFGVPGSGGQTVKFRPNSDPAVLDEPDGPNNPRWVSPTPGGVYYVGNRHRTGNGLFVAEGDIRILYVTKRLQYAVRDHHQLKNQASTYTAAPTGANGLKVGYPWNPNVASGQPGTLVGADYTNGYVTGAAIGTSTPEFASFPVQGAVQSVDCPYPHPLRQTPVSTAPSFTSVANTSFQASAAGTYTVTASGNPAPTFTMPAPGTGGVPAWLSLTSGGVLSGTAPGIGSTSNFTITAQNGVAPNATQSFTLTVNAIQVSLDTPATGQQFTQPATVNITATASSTNGLSKVEFYAGATLLNAPGDTTSPYSFVWTGMADGAYSITAKAYDSVSGTATSTAIPITVTTVVAPTLPPPNIVVGA